jgi:RecQ family ATP-dependent DNA helicase
MERTIYRLGAELLSVRQFMEKQPENQAGLYHALQAMTSAVEVTGLRVRPPGNPDDRFIAEIALGLLCRGWPTLSTPLVEETLLRAFAPELGLQFEAGLAHEVTWHLRVDEDSATDMAVAFNRGLLPVDDRLRTWPAATLHREDSKAEALFHDEFLPRLLGPLAACVEWQRPLESMIEDPTEQRKVASQRADFTLELPGIGHLGKPLLLNMEVDGPHHDEPQQRNADRDRDRVLEGAEWLVDRIATRNLGPAWQPDPKVTDALANNPIVGAALAEPSSLTARCVLIQAPHAIARIQLAVLLALRNRTLSLVRAPWRILVREREVPAAQLALADLHQTLIHLCDIYDLDEPPGIEVKIETDYPNLWGNTESPATDNTFDFIDTAFGPPGTYSPREFDVAIDASVLCRPNQWYGDERVDDGWIRLRTAYRHAGAQPLAWSDPRRIDNPLEKEESLTYFLQTCFRKYEFRDGQLQIIERALRRQSVIGLLPTGAGKSLTYQLPALLTPGITIVIDPIKSLMQDQVDNLQEAGIDSAVTINSDQSVTEKAASERRLGAGEVRFGFISPERLQIQGFRETLSSICRESPVAFAVVDEAHCVSEWGHDFRTAYLNLGRHVRDFMQHQGAAPPLVALTGTASRAVLIDVQRELEITAPEAIVEPDNFDRPELHYVITKVPSSEKRAALTRLLTELPNQLQSMGFPFEPAMMFTGQVGGILFCPHVNGNYGVHALAGFLESLPGWSGKVDFYCGETPKNAGISKNDWPAYKARVQQKFKKNELSLLAATKAFGMGIDKPNIRYTVHLGAPESVEALMQEMGRAGRDRQPAICHVLFSDRNDPDDQDPLQKLISIEDARKRLDAVDKGGADDSCRMLYLHTLGYVGAEREALDIILYLRKYVYPHWGAQRPPDPPQPLPVDPSTVETFLTDQATERLNEAKGAGLPVQVNGGPIANPVYNPGIVTDFDRIVYRLSLLGLITDYTVNYAAQSRNQHQLTTARVSDDEIRSNLYKYIRRYRSAYSLSDLDDKIACTAGDSYTERAIRVLSEFVYDQIESQRREAIWNIRDMLRRSDDGEQLRRRLSEYFDKSVFRPLIFDLLTNAENALRWPDIIDLVTNESEAGQLLGQAHRGLESSPNNPALLLLSGIAQAASDTPDPARSAESLLLGIAKLLESDLRHVHDEAVQVIAKLRALAPAQVEPLLGGVVARHDDSVPGVPEAASILVTAALPYVSNAELRSRCASVVVHRLYRAENVSADLSSAVAQQTVNGLLASGTADSFDSAIFDILRRFRPDATSMKYQLASARFARSAYRNVRDPAVKKACAAPILHDLYRSVQQIV